MGGSKNGKSPAIIMPKRDALLGYLEDWAKWNKEDFELRRRFDFLGEAVTTISERRCAICSYEFVGVFFWLCGFKFT